MRLVQKETRMKIIHSAIFELPTAQPATIEYRYNPATHFTEVWCSVYHIIGGKRQIGDSTFLKELRWLPMNDAGVDWKDEASRHFMEHYAERRWSEQSATDTALGFVPSEQWL